MSFSHKYQKDQKRNYLIAPSTGDPSVLFHASTQLDVLVRGVQMTQTVFDVRYNPPQRLPGQYHSRPTHAEVLVVLQRQQSELFRIPSAGLSDVHRPSGIDGPQERLQPICPYVYVVVCPQEPLEAIAKVVPHIF